MKSPEQIVEFLDQMIAWSLERPRMYAPSAEALEEVLKTYEQVRGFILLPEQTSISGLLDGLHDFYRAKGLGVGNNISSFFCDRDEAEKFQVLGNYWNEYLKSSFRPMSFTKQKGSGIG